MNNIVLPPDASRAAQYCNAKAIPLKHLRSDGSITAPDASGVQVMPPSPDRAALWQRAAAVPQRYLYPDGSVYDIDPESWGKSSTPMPATNSFSQTFSNATFEGTVSAIEMEFNNNESIVSFWGYANQIASGATGQAFVILDPVTYPLLQRFIGQVDQFAIGYNSGTGDFKYTPLRITALNGFELVTAPNISVGTRFSFQFVLILAD